MRSATPNGTLVFPPPRFRCKPVARRAILSGIKGIFLSSALVFGLPSHSKVSTRTAPSSPGRPPFAVNLHVSEKVAFLHFVDTVSAWSPYCDAETVDFRFLGIPALGEEDNANLLRYASARKPLGYEAETQLFLWAEQDFPLQDRPAEYGELKAVLAYFMAKPEFREPLLQRMRDLEDIAPKVLEEMGRLDDQMASLRGVTDAFLREDAPRWNEVPMFLMYTFSATHSQGGANGDGIYAEVDPGASRKAISYQCNIFLHEALHRSLRPRQAFLEFACSRNDRRPGARCRSLRQCAPDERGDDESAMLDEILVYAISEIVVGGKEAETEFQRAMKNGDKQYIRLWDGVRSLLPSIQRQIKKPQSKDRFLHRLVTIFTRKIHFEVWEPPPVKSAGSPLA